MSSQTTEIILYTKPVGIPIEYSVMTVKTYAPYFVGRETCTHKRLARNYSSARYMGHKRHAALGYYIPDIFYGEDGRAYPEALQQWLLNDWIDLEETVRGRLESRDSYLISMGQKPLEKQQQNRQLTTAKMEVGIVTATYSAWKAWFKLRCASDADRAMQEVANSIRTQMVESTPVESNFHAPYADSLVTTLEEYEKACTYTPARLARVSAARPGPGQRGEEELMNSLKEKTHISPFEHNCLWIAVPYKSALNSKKSDRYFPYGSISSSNYHFGWQNLRSEMEYGNE